jgi:protein ImuB
MSQSLRRPTLVSGDTGLPQSQSHVPRPRNELWIAVCFPKFSFEALSTKHLDQAVVVTDVRNGRTHVVAANDAAIAIGIQSGMRLSVAFGLSASLVALERRLDMERLKLEELAVVARRFTPIVSLDFSATLLLEVGGSLKLFAGIAAIKERLSVLLRSHRLTFRMCAAPTALAALWMARCGKDDVLSARTLIGRLSEIPLRATQWPNKAQALLKNMGVHTLGDCMRLPRDGFARRIGHRYLQELDRARGDRELRSVFEPAVALSVKIELDEEIDSKSSLARVGKKLVDRLLEDLRLRQLRISGFDCVFRHLGRTDTVECIRFSEPTREKERFVRLLEDRFERLQLVAPVVALTLRADSTEPDIADPRCLFGACGNIDLESAERSLIERLQSRFGAENLYGMDCVEEHRPEAAWIKSTRFLQRRPQPPLHVEQSPPRPLWLLQIPQRLQVTSDNLPCYGNRAPLRFKRDPERIENGWWDGREVLRDYYRASSIHGERLWIFQERRPSRHWYLHGFFG